MSGRVLIQKKVKNFRFGGLLVRYILRRSHYHVNLAENASEAHCR